MESDTRDQLTINPVYSVRRLGWMIVGYLEAKIGVWTNATVRIDISTTHIYLGLPPCRQQSASTIRLCDGTGRIRQGHKSVNVGCIVAGVSGHGTE